MAQLDWYIRANLKPRHLQLLVALDDLRNLGKVATSLHVSQPAVSLALGELERGLGFKLFERSARGVNPNAYGECLIRQARVVLASLAQARDELHALLTGASGKCTLGALPAMTPSMVPLALARLKQSTPGTTVAVIEGPMETLLPQLRRGAIDLIVGRLANPREGTDDLQEKALFNGSSTLVVDARHPLARRRRLRWQDLEGFPWVLPPVGSLPRDPLEAAFQQHGMAMPANAIETLSTPVIFNYLRATEAIGLLSRVVAHHYRGLGQLAVLPLELPDVMRPIGLTWRRDAALSPSTVHLMRAIETVAAEAAPWATPPRAVARTRRTAAHKAP
jgi:DNA-binding transcriptional LysR family regulator